MPFIQIIADSLTDLFLIILQQLNKCIALFCSYLIGAMQKLAELGVKIGIILVMFKLFDNYIGTPGRKFFGSWQVPSIYIHHWLVRARQLIISAISYIVYFINEGQTVFSGTC